MAALEDRGAEMDVVDVQRAAVDGDVDALQPPRLARLPRQIVLEVLRDRKAAEHGVAELVAAQLPRRRHHPAHAERRADLLGVAAAVRAGADHFLQRDDVGVDRAQHRGDALGPRPAVEAAAAMDVVGGDAQRRARPWSHYAMIVRASRASSRALRVAGASRRSAACSQPPPESRCSSTATC